MTPEDLAWVATDLLTLAIDEEFPDRTTSRSASARPPRRPRAGCCSTGMAAASTRTRSRYSTTWASTPGQAGRQGGEDSGAQGRLAPRLAQ